MTVQAVKDYSSLLNLAESSQNQVKQGANHPYCNIQKEVEASCDKCCNHEPGPTKELTLPLQPTILNLVKSQIANKT
ncbi:MAG TPA: hypothetical protein VEP90_05240 [Methylomirabilota bacterium]|nr:hypothetical protein [Methylomirabilota bacterium]